jgi:hypothetical protein
MSGRSKNRRSTEKELPSNFVPQIMRFANSIGGEVLPMNWRH